MFDGPLARLGCSDVVLFPAAIEADWRLFCTLVRFDAVYYGHFKCNLRRIVDDPVLQGYLCDLYQQPGIAATVNLDHIKRHYYATHDDINPTRIVPLARIFRTAAAATESKPFYRRQSEVEPRISTLARLDLGLPPVKAGI